MYRRGPWERDGEEESRTPSGLLVGGRQTVGLPFLEWIEQDWEVRLKVDFGLGPLTSLAELGHWLYRSGVERKGLS